MNILTLRIIDLQQFLNMSLLLCQREVKDTKSIFLCLNEERVTNRSITSLLSRSLASLVRQSVVLTTVAV